MVRNNWYVSKLPPGIWDLELLEFLLTSCLLLLSLLLQPGQTLPRPTEAWRAVSNLLVPSLRPCSTGQANHAIRHKGEELLRFLCSLGGSLFGTSKKKRDLSHKKYFRFIGQNRKHLPVI